MDGDLVQMMNEFGKNIEPELIHSLCKQVSIALTSLYRICACHSDIKPQNILYKVYDND